MRIRKKIRKKSKEKMDFPGNKRGFPKKKTVIAAACAVTAAISGGILWQHQAGQKFSSQESAAAATETKAELGEISNTIVGTGNLQTETAVSLKIPSGVTISSLKVESGDHVSKGDVLAVVDQTSVHTAMEELQEEINSLDEKLKEAAEDTGEETITAAVDGRVKKIYIQEGGEISDCMLEQGALLLLSLDGKMAIDLENPESSLSQNETVTVTLSDGSQIEGTVEQTEGNTCTVTVTDSGADIGDTGTVTDEEGNTVGSGSVYIHQPLEITGTGGCVTEVNVAEDEAVESGDTLLTLEAGSDTEALYTSRKALTDALTELLALSKEGAVIADRDGTIEEIYVSEEGSSSSAGETADQSGTGVQAASMSYRFGTGSQTGNQIFGSGTGVQLISLSSGTGSSGDAGSLSAEEGEAVRMEETEEAASEEVLFGSGEESEVPDTEVSFEDGTLEDNQDSSMPESGEENQSQKKLSLEIVDNSIGNAQLLGISAPRIGGNPQSEMTTSDGSYTGTISWNPGDAVFQPNITYQAFVTLTAGNGYYFQEDSISQTAAGLLSGVAVSEDRGTIAFTLTFPETGEGTEHSEGTAAGNEQGSSQESGTGSSQGGSQESGTESSQGGSQESGTGSGQGTQGIASAGSGNSAGTQSASSQETETEEQEDQTSQYSTKTAAFAISGDTSMILSVNVDELDINSVSLGQKAEVTFDAIEDQTFEGTVTKVGSTASVSGGTAKYTVEITVGKEEQMRAGMNASATIVIEEKEDVVTIPVNALQERGDQVFVYTEQGEDGTLSGEQQVTTGLSDGEKVEITEGLSEGDVVYYQKTGNQSSSFGTGEEMPGGSQDRAMPGGGQSGGMPGGSQDGAMPGGGFDKNMGGDR